MENKPLKILFNRRNALQHKVSYTTTLSGAEAACLAMKYEDRQTVTRLQDLH